VFGAKYCLFSKTPSILSLYPPRSSTAHRLKVCPLPKNVPHLQARPRARPCKLCVARETVRRVCLLLLRVSLARRPPFPFALPARTCAPSRASSSLSAIDSPRVGLLSFGFTLQRMTCSHDAISFPPTMCSSTEVTWVASCLGSTLPVAGSVTSGSRCSARRASPQCLQFASHSNVGRSEVPPPLLAVRNKITCGVGQMRHSAAPALSSNGLMESHPTPVFESTRVDHFPYV
jgi:hypothetical protein